MHRTIIMHNENSTLYTRRNFYMSYVHATRHTRTTQTDISDIPGAQCCCPAATPHHMLLILCAQICGQFTTARVAESELKYLWCGSSLTLTQHGHVGTRQNAHWEMRLWSPCNDLNHRPFSPARSRVLFYHFRERALRVGRSLESIFCVGVGGGWRFSVVDMRSQVEPEKNQPYTPKLI